MSVRAKAMRAFTDEGLLPHEWSNAAGDKYGLHDHPYEKLIYCIEGGIEFELPSEKRIVELVAGQHLVVPPHTPHSGLVGPSGCVCVEGHRFRP